MNMLPHRLKCNLRAQKVLISLSLALAGFILAGGRANAQAPVNLLKFGFDDAGTGNTTPSDTSLGGVSVNLTMFNGAGTATDYHGSAGSGVSGALNGNRALTFTNQPSLSQPGNTQPGNPGPVAALINSSALGFGSITSFVATIWIKESVLMASSGANVNIGPRLWILNAGATALDAGGSANTISLKCQSANQVYFQFGTDTVTVGPALPNSLSANKWLFFAVVYDGATAKLYTGSDTETATLAGTGASPGRVLNLGATACLAIGNRASNRARSFAGWMDDFRFYTNSGDASFVESVRQSAVGGAPIVTGIYPDGLKLQQATNTFSFTASSPSGAWGPSVAVTNIQLVLNGVDVSGSLVTSGSTTNTFVTYNGLIADRAINTAVITVRDAKGLIGTGSATFDTFRPNNFVWEAEEFDHDSGQFIDNADYTSYATNTSYFGLDSVEAVDTHKGTGNPAVNASDYRAGSADASRTQTAQATGEVARQRFLDLVTAGDAAVVDHIVGNWSSSDWENYTRTFPAGVYNVYGRLSAGAGSATVRLDKITSGQGTSTQTLTNIGTFTATGSSYTTYQWVPLRDSFGNLAVVNLAGLNTVRVTTGGGANANFFMLAPANTNLPSITAVYPDGLVLFESTNKFVFTVGSAATINTNSVSLTLNGSNVSSGLVFTGSSTSGNVSYTGLLPSQSYTAVINVTDVNGNSASSTVNIDTYNPVLVWEAEDFDFDPSQSPVPGSGKRYIDNAVPTTAAAANSYFGQVGLEGVDEHTVAPHTGGSPNNYRPSDFTATTLVTDAARQQFISAGAPDYNVGFLGNFYWQEYTRTFPTGTFNIYAREARGDAGAVNINLDKVTGGWGTTAQLTKRVGTFSLPGGGGWSAYKYSPLIDQFGNYANVVLGGTNTFRTTVTLPVNVNFYMLVAARTDLARIDNVYPDGAVLQQRTNTLSFIASSPAYGINTTNIHVTLNGVNISSNLVITGSSTSWNVSYPGLQPNTTYTAAISVTDAHAQTAATTVTFDTFSPGNFAFEAEDFDFDPANSPVPNGSGNRYIDNPSPTSSAAANSYFGQVGALGIDYSTTFGNAHPGTYIDRPADYVVTEVGSDAARQKFLTAQQAALDPNIVDYDVAFWTNGAFINWTRTFPSGNFNLYARLAGGNGAFNLQVAQVTGGWGTASQTSQYLGTFRGSGTSFTAWQYVPLINTNTLQPIVLNLAGTNTLQMTADGNENANFFMLVPAIQSVGLTASLSGGNIVLSFATSSGFNYTIQYKNTVNDLTWTILSTVAGDGTTKTVTDGASGGSRFYRLSIQ